MSEHRSNFFRALIKLQEFIALPIAHDRDRAGIIQAFEFAFEQAWRALKEASESQSLPAPSPRKALQRGVEFGLLELQDEDDWLLMLHDRNMTSHVYNEAQSIDICGRICEGHIKLLLKLKNALALEYS